MTGATLAIIGAGGHAKVAADAWRSAGGEVDAFYVDDRSKHGGRVLDVPVAGAVADAAGLGYDLHLAIGDNGARRRLAEQLSASSFPVVRHAASVVSPIAQAGPGALLAALAVLQVDCRVGAHTIVNTSAIVEHDCMVGAFVHLAPGTRLGGGVVIEDGAFVGTGAVILPGLRVGAGAVIGAGAVVLRNVPPGAIMAGNPARPLRP